MNAKEDITAYHNIVRSVSRKYTRSHPLARYEDLEAEGLYWLILGLKKWNGKGSCHGYLYWYVEKRIISYLRMLFGCKDRKKVNPFYFEEHVNDFDKLSLFESYDNIVDRVDHELRLSRLDPRSRDMMIRKSKGAHLWEIGEAYGLTESRVSQCMKEARRVYEDLGEREVE